VRRAICLVACLVVAGLSLPAAAAPAAPVALLDAPHALDVAVAGGEVLMASQTRRGGLRLRAVPAGGGPARQVVALPPPGRGWVVSDARLSSSAQVTALLVSFADPRGALRDWRVYAGPPAGPLELIQRVRSRRPGTSWAPLDVDANGDRLLVQEIRLPNPSFRFMVFAPGAPPVRVPQGRIGVPAAIAGDDLAYVGVGGRADAPAALRIVDWRTGMPRASFPLGDFSEEVDEGHLDMAEGGRVVAEFDGRLLAAAPGEALRRLRGTAGASALSSPRFAGERVAALDLDRLGSQRPVLIDPGAGTRRTLGPPSSVLDALAAGEGTVAWLANGCVLAAGLDGGDPGAAPPPGPCPRSEVLLGEGGERVRGGRLRVRVTCVAAPAAGCRGTALLGRGGWAGRGRFRVPARQRRSVRVRLSRRGMAHARRRVRRFGHASLLLTARVKDGRVAAGPEGPGVVLIERVG
jgi:hypothetical protein